MPPSDTFTVCREFAALLSILLLMIAIEGANGDRFRCEKPNSMPNGVYRVKRNFMKVFCNAGYQLQGFKTIRCVRGKWDGERPVCARKGCSKALEKPANGQIQIEGDLKAILYCSDGYSVAGNHHMYCNGTHWDRPIGSCRERSDKVLHECDFETDDMCGWSNEVAMDLEWKRVMAVNVFTSFKTGPLHDHTTLTHNGGHYMLMESMIRQFLPVTLTSPIYESHLTLEPACFQFYYYMYGAGIGDLLVVVKPETLTVDEILLSRQNSAKYIKFKKNGNQNNIWNEAHFTLDEMDEDFQIVFVAKGGRAQLSDIAVDDVRLLTGDDCTSLDMNGESTTPNEEYDTTTYQSLYEMQSCVGRCYNTSYVGVVRTGGHLMGLCSCEADCEDADTCCPDFKDVCVSELFESSVDDSVTFSAQEVSAVSTTPGSTTSTTTTTATTTTSTTPVTTTTTRTTPTTTATTTTTTTTTTPKITTTTTTPKTTTTTTTPKTTTTSTTPKTTSTTTRKSTTPVKTTVKTTTTTTTTTTRRPTTTTLRTTTTPATTTVLPQTTRPTESTTMHLDNSRNSRVKTPPQKPSNGTKSAVYAIDSDPKVEAAHRGSSLLTWTLILIVIIVVAGLAYRRFGDHAVAWYMIRFSKRNANDDDDTSAITTSFKRPQSKSSGDEKGTKKKSRMKCTYPNDSKQPLVEDDVDDEDNDAVNGNIALKNSIYTEL